MFTISLNWKLEVSAPSEDDAIEKYKEALKKELRIGGPFDCYEVIQEDNGGDVDEREERYPG